MISPGQSEIRALRQLIGLFAMTLSGVANAQTYAVTYLGTLGGGTGNASAINSSGTIVGYSKTFDNSAHAFSYRYGIMTDIGTLGGEVSFALGINDAGAIAGVSVTAGTATDHAFSYSNGIMTDLGTLGGSISYAYGINSAGTVVGYSTTSAGDQGSHPFSYSNGVMSNLGSFGGQLGVANGINSAGTIVGYSTTAGNAENAFSYSNGIMTNLGTLGGPSSVATAINDEGTIVGYSTDASNTHIDAFSYSNGTMTDLGTLNGYPTYATAINNKGTIVGNSSSRAFVYRNGTMTDLNTLARLPGLSNELLIEAPSINDSGQIVANSFYNAYLLTPATSGHPARLTNISTRAQVGTGGNILIPGFVVGGSGSETLLIRADGPSLSQYSVPGVLAQPILSVLNSAGAVIASNTGWSTNPDPSQISSISAQVGAFPLNPSSADCALIVSLPAGAYTVQVSGVNNTSGVALAEVYEVSSTGTRLINVSTRSQVGTAANIVIPGFVVTGDGTEQLLVRADGPALTQFGVAGILAHPSLGIFDGSGTMIASNTGWGTTTSPDYLANVAAFVGAFALTAGSSDSAQVVNLPAGAYTMQVSGAANTTGVALAELYEVP